MNRNLQVLNAFLAALMLAALLPPMTARGEEAEREDEVSGTVIASRALNIVGLDYPSARALFQSAVLQAAEKWGLRQEFAGGGTWRFGSLTPPPRFSAPAPVSSFPATIEIDLTSIDAPPVAKEIADAAVEQFRQAAEEAIGRLREQYVGRHEREHQSAQLSVRARGTELEQMRNMLMQQTGRTDASPEALRTAMGGLDDRRQGLDLELAGLGARGEALRQLIDEQTDKVSERLQRDPVIEQLEAVVKAREQEPERIRPLLDAGRAGVNDLNDAIARLAEARIRLAERREAVYAAAGGDHLDAWTRQLQELSIDLREKEAQLRLVNEQLEKLRAASGLLAEIERAQRELLNLQMQARRAEEALRQAQQEWDQQRLGVTVVDAQDTTEQDRWQRRDEQIERMRRRALQAEPPAAAD